MKIFDLIYGVPGLKELIPGLGEATRALPDMMGGQAVYSSNGLLLAQLRPDGAGGQVLLDGDGHLQASVSEGMLGTSIQGADGSLLGTAEPSMMGDGASFFTPQGELVGTATEGLAGNGTDYLSPEGLLVGSTVEDPLSGFDAAGIDAGLGDSMGAADFQFEALDGGGFDSSAFDSGDMGGFDFDVGSMDFDLDVDFDFDF